MEEERTVEEILGQESPETAQPAAAGKYNRLFAVLAYCGMFWILGLVIHPECDDPFVKSHVNNGIIMSILAFVAPFVNFILIFGQIIFVSYIFAAIAFWFICVIKAIMGRPYTLPVIGDKFQFVR